MRALILSAAVAEEWPLGVESAWPAGEWMLRLPASQSQGERHAEADERKATGAIRPEAGLLAVAPPAANDA